MTTLEERVRESLHSYASIPRPPADLADTVIAGGRTARRRRTAAVAVAAVLAVATVSGGVTLVADIAGGTRNPVGSAGSSRPPSAAPSSYVEPTFAVNVDVLVGNDLHKASGGVVTLDGVGTVTWVAQVPAGWLYSGTNGGTWLLRRHGSATALPGVPAHPAVSSDGSSLAWASGATAWAAALTDDGLENLTSTPVPAPTTVTTWIGSRVVLGWTAAPNDVRHDLWAPAKGDFVANWTADIMPVYGPVPVGVRGVGLVHPAGGTRSPTGCLAQLDGAVDMSVVSRSCLPGLVWSSTTGLLSPDGRYLAEPGTNPATIAVIDVEAGKVPRTCPATTALVWEDERHLLAGTANGEVIRCSVDPASRPGNVPYLQVGGASSVTLVPRYLD